MSARRARVRPSTLRCYERLARAALLETGELSHHVKRWAPVSRKMLKTALYRLGFKRQALAVSLGGAR